MNAIVIEHLPVAELPTAWRDKLRQLPDDHVTVPIEEEVAALRWLERIWLYNASPLLQEALARQHAAVVRRNQALVTQNLG